MIVVRRVGAGGLRRGHHKLFGRNRAQAAEQHKSTDGRKALGSRHRRAKWFL
jgi:hypothetical protein